MIESKNNDILIAKIEDAVTIADRKHIVKTVGFLSPSEIIEIKSKVKNSKVLTTFWGGFEDAERKMFIAVPDWADLDEEKKNTLSSIEITGRDIKRLSHRDFLGSILGLGIKREQIGDIVVLDEKTIIFVQKSILPFIMLNLRKIGNCGINICEVTDESDCIPKKKTELISGTVSSLRLDSILALACKKSRSHCAEFIKAGIVSVNWSVKDNVSYILEVNDVFSVRGFGRFKLSQFNGMTKKDRCSICIEKYI